MGPAPDFDEVKVSAESNAAEVYNTPPSLTGAIIQEQSAAPGDTLSCIPQGFADNECNPTPSYVFAWFVGADQILGEISDTFSTDGLQSGVEVACRAIPFDGVDYGAPKLSPPITLNNNAPTAPVVSLNAPNGADGDLTCEVVQAAQDDEALSSTFKWLINGNVHSTTTNVLPAAVVSHCDFVSCQLSVSDGALSAQSNISDVLLPLGSDCDDNELL